MGQGDMVWEKFGHNSLWIHDPERGTDTAYNYGMFDFNQPGFLGRFLRGRWIYWMEGFPAVPMIDFYRQTNRSVWVQELNLLPAQKRELRDFLEWNARPENRDYRYDYFHDNCSTRIRDALDRALGGALRAATGDSLTDKSFRWHSRRLVADDRASYAGMNAGLGPAADGRITAWDEMFIPMKLQEHLRSVQTTDATGRPVPLVASEEQLFAAMGRAPERPAPPRWTVWFALVGLVLGGSVATLSRLVRRVRGARFGVAALSALWSLLAGFGGLLLLLLWTLTDHAIAFRNENLLQLNPLGLALLLLLPPLAYGARWAARPAVWVAAAMVALSLLGIVLGLLPGWIQGNAEMIALALPAHLGMFAAALHLRRTLPAAPRRI